MINDRIVTVGEKIKEFRLSLGATQVDIATEFDRAYLCQLEKRKNERVSYKSAMKIVKCFQNFISKENLEVENITIGYLTEYREAQVIRVIEYKYGELTKINIEEINFNIKLKEIIKLINQYKVYNLGTKVYKYAENQASSKGFIEKRIDYGIEGAEMAFKAENKEEYINFKLSIAGAYIIKKNYDESLRVYKRLLKIVDPKDIDTLKKIFFNVALAYYHKENYNKCNETLQKLINSKNIEIDDSLDKRIKSIQIGCFTKLNDLDKAEIECKLLLERLNTDDCELLWKTYKSLSAISYRKNDYVTSKNYIEQALRLKNSIKTYSLINLYMDAADIYKKINMLDKAIEYYNDCIEIAQALKKDSIVNEALTKITALYIKLKKIDELEALYNKVA